MNQRSEPKYRWYILTLGVVTHILVYALPRICITVLLPEISADLNLSLVQMGMVWGISNLPVVFFSLFGGMLGDRFGTAKVLAFSCLLQGVLSALRGFSGDYATLLSFTFLFGMVGVAIPYTTHKAAGQWFSGRQLGLANGILAMGMGAGFALGAMVSATVLSPLLGGWRNIMFVYGGLAVVVALLWMRIRPAPAREGASPSEDAIPLRQSLSHVIRLRPIWFLAFGLMFLNGGRNGVIGYIPTYLSDMGWSVASASAVVTVLSLTSVIGAVPITVLSDKIGLRKIVFIPAILIATLGYGLLSVVTNEAIWPLMVITGLVQEANAAFFFTLGMESKGVGMRYSGTALGLIQTFGGLGAFIGPPLGNGLAVSSPAYSFICWGGLAALAAVAIFFVKETGWKKRQQASA